MKNKIIITFIIFIFASSAYSQRLTSTEAEAFIHALINNSEELKKYFDENELKYSERLGISYKDVKYKLLISLDIDPVIKSQILNKQINYEYTIEALENDYSKLIIKIPSKKHQYEFVFNKSRLVSKPTYYSGNWVKIYSNYFVFHTGDSTMLNGYTMDKLDSFVEQMLKLLKCSKAEIRKLKKEKIHYFLCRDDSEIMNLTGYSARGLYYIANDFIISTFNCHYHEIVHLLINYRLKSTALYTQPLLQEGFAVAFGGRGGVESGVILNMGLFLVKSDFIDYQSLMSKESFYQTDASMSYPVAGLYTKFLIDHIGIDKYLKLYSKYSSPDDRIDNTPISAADLPVKAEWEKHLINASDYNPISITKTSIKDFPVILTENEDFAVFANDTEYLIKARQNIGISSDKDLNYKSRIFNELYPGKRYKNEKYIITVNPEEVSIYNVLTNNLIAKYVKAFTINRESVAFENGYYIFSVHKNVFDENLMNMRFLKSGI